jgi:hypothetical protein
MKTPSYEASRSWNARIICRTGGSGRAGVVSETPFMDQHYGRMIARLHRKMDIDAN